MASRGQYLLRIGGRLTGRNVQRNVVETMVNKVFAKPDAKLAEGVPGKKTTGGWPNGFILKGYTICQWTQPPLLVDSPNDGDTMINFRAEIHHTLPGSLFGNKEKMLPHVEWFYNSRDYKWHEELRAKLKEVNDELEKKYGKALVERIWFRDWQWYCGNGGC
jgi:hypothetical protein